MSESNGRCEFEHLDYCCLPKWMIDSGFRCSKAISPGASDICEKCGASDDDLMTEEEFEEWSKEQEPGASP